MSKVHVKKSFFWLKQLPLTEGITVIDILLEVQTNKCPSKGNPACQIYIFFPWNHIFNTREENGKSGREKKSGLENTKKGAWKDIFAREKKTKRGIKLANTPTFGFHAKTKNIPCHFKSSFIPPSNLIYFLCMENPTMY